MSSIYTDNFNAVIKRTYSNSDSSIKPKDKSEKSKENFSSLLASVEIKKENQASSKPQTNQDLDKILSNLSKEPASGSKKINQNPYPPSPSIIIGDIPLEDDEIEKQIESVKSSLNSDKNTTPSRGDNKLEPKLPDPNFSSDETKLGEEVAKLQKAPTPVNKQTKVQDNISQDKIKEIIKTAGKFHGVDPSLGLAVAEVESAFNPTAISMDGHESKGVFQLLDSTAMDMKNLNEINDPYDPFDPSMNSFLGVSYLRRLLDLFSKESQLTPNTKTFAAKSAVDLEKIAVAAYNTGEGNVARAQARAQSLGKDPSTFSAVEPHLPEITKDYVRKVTSIRNSLSASLIENFRDNG